MKDGYEAEENDLVTIEKSGKLSDVTSEEIYNILGCEALDEE